MVKQTHVRQGAIPGELPGSTEKEAAKYGSTDLSKEPKPGDTVLGQQRTQGRGPKWDYAGAEG